MQVKDIIQFLERKAPPVFQENYDNSGLICGDREAECTGVLVCLDSVEAIIDEAIDKNCNLVVAHHPILFSGLKRITGKTYMERTIIKAIKNDVAIYAIHTNLDNVMSGVNQKFADTLGLQNTRILAPKNDTLNKLSFYVPMNDADQVKEALFSAGAGEIGNYSHCSFNVNGTGTFKANEHANPHVGQKNEVHSEAETKVEVLVGKHVLGKVVNALLEVHPYEEVAYDIYALLNSNSEIGSGMVGELETAMNREQFLNHLKSSMKTDLVRYTKSNKKMIKKVAICGGSGSFLLNNAKACGADAFVTGDFKYHQFFDAEGEIMICDIGHFESEQFTIALLGDWLTENFPKFAVHFTEINTNPVNYF